MGWVRRSLENVDEAQRRYLAEAADQLAEAADQLAQAFEEGYAERDRRRAAGQDPAELDAMLATYAATAERALVHLKNLEVFQAVLVVVEGHGPGPWPTEDLAVIAGVDPSPRYGCWRT
jgi:hypothetical protein